MIFRPMTKEVIMGDKWYIGDGLEDNWEVGDAPGYSRGPDQDAYAAAAKKISDWGAEGVQSAAALVGDAAAQGMLRDHIRNNVQQACPGLELNGSETTEQLQRKIKSYRRQRTEQSLNEDDRKAAADAKATLRKLGLLDDD
jgi:hypothetical protein